MPRSRSSPGRHAPVAVLAVTLAVFAMVVGYVTLWLRSGLREQILQREADALTQVASVQLATEADTLAQLGLKSAPGELLNTVLQVSTKMRGVFAVRVFDGKEQFAGALPFPWTDAPPTAADWAELVAGHPIARLHSRASAAEVIGLAPPVAKGRRDEPLMETWLPLRKSDHGPLAGAAQMWTDGQAVAREFAALDHRLLTQAALAWAAGAVIITALLGWAFRRLAQANRELQARSEDLLRANRELTLAAKTSALGAVTAHLMHELKNPVAGLEQFVATQSEGGADHGGELAAASELTRRLRTMINDVVSVMRDEQTAVHFELACADIAELVLAKVRPVASVRGVTLEAEVRTSESLPGRRANLVMLVLHNLLQNAIEASPANASVRLTAAHGEGKVFFCVADHGPGLAPEVRARLFQPCPSTKRGGSGIGLALSQQLARQAGGQIELLSTNAEGTCFRVALASAWQLG